MAGQVIAIGRLLLHAVEYLRVPLGQLAGSVQEIGLLVRVLVLLHAQIDQVGVGERLLHSYSCAWVKVEAGLHET